LDHHGALHGRDHTGKLGQHAIPGRADDTAPVVGDLGVDQLAV
jgi:hypothetical protein